MVLELSNIVAFIDPGVGLGKALFLDIQNAGSYGADMAMQLKREEIIHFQEIFLFTNPTASEWNFRALAEKVEWRKFDHSPYGDLNY